jgi:hypothetical protein
LEKNREMMEGKHNHSQSASGFEQLSRLVCVVEFTEVVWRRTERERERDDDERDPGREREDAQL